ncbi:hypothetical protein BHM03_00062517 [Ensete ventricosum]|nr:hypothetical protein BHM03_00062517 [Ensete ventricosum]
MRRFSACRALFDAESYFFGAASHTTAGLRSGGARGFSTALRKPIPFEKNPHLVPLEQEESSTSRKEEQEQIYLLGRQ